MGVGVASLDRDKSVGDISMVAVVNFKIAFEGQEAAFHGVKIGMVIHIVDVSVGTAGAWGW